MMRFLFVKPEGAITAGSWQSVALCSYLLYTEPATMKTFLSVSSTMMRAVKARIVDLPVPHGMLKSVIGFSFMIEMAWRAETYACQVNGFLQVSRWNLAMIASYCGDLKNVSVYYFKPSSFMASLIAPMIYLLYFVSHNFPSETDSCTSSSKFCIILRLAKRTFLPSLSSALCL